MSRLTQQAFEDMWMSAWYIGDMLHKLKVVSRSEQMHFENRIGVFIIHRKDYL